MKKLFFGLCILLWVLVGQSWGATVFIKNIGGAVYYDSSCSSCDGVTAEDTAGSIVAALTESSTNGIINICVGTYSGTMLDASGGLKTTASGQSINGIGMVVIDGVSAGTHTFSPTHSCTLNNIEFTGSTGTNYNIYGASNLTIVGYGVKITNGARGIFNNGTLTLWRSTFSGISGAYFINNNVAGNTANIYYSVFKDSAAYYTAFKGTHNLANNLFIGNLNEAFVIGTDSAQVVNLNNNVFVANSVSLATKHIVSNTSANAVVSGANNLILGNPFDPIDFGINNMGTLTGTIYDSPEFTTPRRTGIINLHMHFWDFSDLSVISPVAAYAANLGQYITLGIRGVRTLVSGDWAFLNSFIAQGHSVVLTTENHLTLTSLGGLTITGPAGSTMTISIDDSAASSDSWTGTVVLGETGEPAKYTFDISGSGSYGTLLTLSNAIEALPLWTSIVANSGDGTGATNRRNSARSVSLANVTGVSTASAYATILDRNRMYYTELVEPKKIIETHGIAVNGIDCPGGSSDATVRAWLSSDAAGWWAKGGTIPFLAAWSTSGSGSYTMADDYQSASAYGLSIYQIWWALVEDYFATSDIDRRAATLVDFANYTGALMTIVFHQNTYSEANWTLILDALHNNFAGVNNSEATIAYVRSGTDADANGLRWTRSFPVNDNYRVSKNSILIDAGIDMSILYGERDYYNNLIYGKYNLGVDQKAGMPIKYQGMLRIGGR